MCVCGGGGGCLECKHIAVRSIFKGLPKQRQWSVIWSFKHCEAGGGGRVGKGESAGRP